jgi:hypothetical protein
MFLQTGLGLARNQWDNNFRAFDAYGYQLRRVADLPWMDYNAGDWYFSSAEVPQELWSNWPIIPDNQKDTHPGYQKGLDCYYWGFRPPDLPEAVLFGVRGTRGLGALPAPFRICSFRSPDCPGCPAPPPCPEPSELTPECPPCAVVPAVAPAKYGVNIGLLVAAGLTAGVGYYGYKKGWFKRRS